MDRSDRERWESARTLEDLGELTALWLEGKIASQPGYMANCGPDPETKDLIPVLAACNRAGYVTHSSQPGDEVAGWRQRAAVDGFASPAVTDALRRATDGTGLLIHVREASSWRTSGKDAITVTTANGRHYTGFGVQLSRRFIRDSWEGYGVCRQEAVDALCAAFQVTIVDPEYGRNAILWPALEQFTRN